MTATLTFKLPEEAHEHQLATNAARLAALIDDLDQQARAWLKHGTNQTSPQEPLEWLRGEINQVRDLLHE